MPSGRPRKDGKELQFRTVAVPLEIYYKIEEIARHEDRSIARQLARVIEKAHTDIFNKTE